MAMPIDPCDEQAFEQVATAVRNWGRWGPGDQIGTLNHLTAERVAAAAAEVVTGRTFTLGIDISGHSVWGDGTIRPRPQHVLTVDGGDHPEHFAELATAVTTDTNRGLALSWSTRMRFADDMVIMPLQVATQWDGLAHAWYDDTLYNGFPAGSVTSRGTSRDGIEHAARHGITGRAVLIDVAGHYGVDHLEPNTAITAAELDAVCAAQKTVVRPGDIVLVRTGWWSTFTGPEIAAQWRSGSPGVEWTVASWLHEHEIAAIASDNLAVEASGQGYGWASLPMHMLCLRDMGLTLGEAWNLEELATDCRADGRYSMMLAAPPLPIPGAVGSPINPVAIK